MSHPSAPQVQDDILKQLRIPHAVKLVSSFNRPNIHYSVKFVTDAQPEPLPHIVALLKEGRRAEADGAWPCSIVYALKKESTEEIAAGLTKKGMFPISCVVPCWAALRSAYAVPCCAVLLGVVLCCLVLCCADSLKQAGHPDTCCSVWHLCCLSSWYKRVTKPIQGLSSAAECLFKGKNAVLGCGHEALGLVSAP